LRIVAAVAFGYHRAMRSSLIVPLCLVLTTAGCPNPVDPADTTAGLASTTGGTSEPDSAGISATSQSGSTSGASTGAFTGATTTDATTEPTTEPTTAEDATTAAGTTTDTTATGGDTSGGSCMEDCIAGLGEPEPIDMQPVHDLGALSTGWIVVGGDEGLRVWKPDGDGFVLHATVPTPSPVVALVAGYIPLGDQLYGVAALCPEAGELLVYQDIAGELSLLDSAPIPVGAVDVDLASLGDATVGDLVVLDRATPRLLPFDHDGAGNFLPLPAIALQGKPNVVSGDRNAGDKWLAAVAEPESSSILIVETDDLLLTDLDVVTLPAAPSDLYFAGLDDIGGPEVLVASELGAQIFMGSPSGIFHDVAFEAPLRIAPGPLYDPFSVLAILHRNAGQVSLGPFTKGEASMLHPPMWFAATIDDPQRILVRGYADVLVSSPTTGLALHRALIP
jgi:hypothetical protein